MQESCQCLAVARPGLKVKRNVSQTLRAEEIKEKQMFIITSVYVKPMDQVEKYLVEHREFLDSYYKKGIFIASGRKATGDGGIIFAKGCTKEEIKKILIEDPFSREKISHYDVIEFSPNRVAEGLEKLK